MHWPLRVNTLKEIEEKDPLTLKMQMPYQVVHHLSTYADASVGTSWIYVLHT